jgi:hypothetical protein
MGGGRGRNREGDLLEALGCVDKGWSGCGGGKQFLDLKTWNRYREEVGGEIRGSNGGKIEGIGKALCTWRRFG